MKADKEKLSLEQIARAIDVSLQTVRNWVLWYEKNYPNVGNLVIPKCSWIEQGGRVVRAYSKEDIAVFKKFKENKLKRWGVMRDYNAERSWGQYGKALLNKKNRRKCYAKKGRNSRNSNSKKD